MEMFTAIQSPNNSFITVNYAKFGLINAGCQFDKYDNSKEELGKAGKQRRDHFHSKTSLNGLVRPKMTNGYQQCLLSEQLPIES
ncbi:hypothetical protein T4C_11698 [Trichinella pseudospiralis]|uniref:Uncharacterized protein n=1 Tax=Trichinella pseudospiralis TaxID=6337 RepID=A0A0V1JQR9_TRIPS|nr:hypothetical protein T4E_1754 [Trichinella pseudospiralis]KRY92050.1 hypothetical protein T4D_15294 [Trichinella pseudospiralis]KRZ37298.1 hypothetical protein T4C_11698 [Trichinella pseudospiralis]